MKTLAPLPAARRLGVIAALAVALGTVTATPALAHTRLVSSTPGKDATAASVSQVTLNFSDRIGFAKVLVKDQKGKGFQSGEAERDGSTVTQRLTGRLPAGGYTVSYAVVGEDGHRIEKSDLSFTATQGGSAGTSDGSGAASSPARQGGQGQPRQAPESPATAPAAEPEDGSSGASRWLVIIVGALIGIGIGMLIVFRATRRHPVPGPGPRGRGPGGKGSRDQGTSGMGPREGPGDQGPGDQGEGRRE